MADELKTWISAQAQAGRTPEEVIATLVQSGWTRPQALGAMQDFLAYSDAPDQPVKLLETVAANDGPDLQPAVPVPEPSLANNATSISVAGHEIEIVMTMTFPRVIVFGNLFTHQECDDLMALAQSRLQRSEAVVNETGGNEVHEARTSDGMFFTRGESAFVTALETRIAALVNWPIENGEGLQILRYGVGKEYKPHWDYFDPKHKGTPTILRRGGQRVATLVTYLNTPERGGATTFPDVGLSVAPVKGSSVFFSYNRADASSKTLHGGAPVEAGVKWVATKWLRERAFT